MPNPSSGDFNKYTLDALADDRELCREYVYAAAHEGLTVTGTITKDMMNVMDKVLEDIIEAHQSRILTMKNGPHEPDFILEEDGVWIEVDNLLVYVGKCTFGTAGVKVDVSPVETTNEETDTLELDECVRSMTVYEFEAAEDGPREYE